MATKPLHPPSADAPLQPGDIVVATERGLPQIKRLYARVSSSTQFRVTDFAGKGAYHRKAVYVVDKPGAEPICLWRNQIKRLPSKARVNDVWRKDGMAAWIP